MQTLSTPPFRMSIQLKILLFVGMAIGIISLKVLAMQDHTRSWFSFLVGAVLFLGMGLFGLFFTSIQFLTSAKWSVGIRRIMEAMALTLPGALILFFFVFKGTHHLYEWSHPEAFAHDEILQWKAPFLTEAGFKLRLVGYFAIWILSSFWLIRNSFKQDRTGDVRLSRINFASSAFILVLFALSVSMAGFEILMSLEPHWFSTIFGIYFFSGFFQAGLAMLFILTWLLYRAGTLRDIISIDHFHDISRFVFGFSIFWAYIGFAQFMLIWYGDLPEETLYFRVRMESGWEWVSLALLFVRFVIPFLVIMPFNAKRNFKIMLPICVLILFGQWLDLYWMAFPAIRLIEGKEIIGATIGWKEVGVGIGFVSLFVGVVGLIMERIRMVPVGDPRLEASIHYYHHG